MGSAASRRRKKVITPTENAREIVCVEEKPSQRQLYKFIYNNIVGKDAIFKGPYGKKRVIYCDYTASGRPLRYIEDYINNSVNELYANTHTTANVTGRTTQQLREEARSIIKRCANASDDDVVIFTGNGVTGAVHKLIGVMNLQETDKKTVMFVGPYEHHSNILPWKESGMKIVRIRETKKRGQIDLSDLETQLMIHASEDFHIMASFSAASNITGIITNTDKISRVVHEYGGAVFWDYATAGPYLPINMNPSQEAYKDAVFLSPHKFVGGPGTPGILIAKRKLFRNTVPHGCGGGTVAYVTRENHRYLTNLEEREEGGTPAIVEAIRAGLVFQLKVSLDCDKLNHREHELCAQAFKVWKNNKNVVVLGSLNAERIPIFSFVVRDPKTRTLLHYNFVAAILNDVFGIQSRGGCACAGPYAEDLLGISEPLANKFFYFLTPPDERQTTDTSQTEDEIKETMDIMKPGFTRLNLPYFADDDVIKYIIDAVDMVGTYGWLLLPQYRFNSHNGAWSHKEARPGGELSLNDVGVDVKTARVHNKRKLTGVLSLEEMMSKARRIFDNATEDAKFFKTTGDEDFIIPSKYKELVWFTTPSDARKCMSDTIEFMAGSRQPFKPRPPSVQSCRKNALTMVSSRSSVFSN